MPSSSSSPLKGVAFIFTTASVPGVAVVMEAELLPITRPLPSGWKVSSPIIATSSTPSACSSATGASTTSATFLEALASSMPG